MAFAQFTDDLRLGHALIDAQHASLFEAVNRLHEAMLAGDPRTGACCHGDTPTLADICLVPQIFNAQRFEARLDHVPTVMRIHRHCLTLPAFAASVPALQPDAE